MDQDKRWKITVAGSGDAFNEEGRGHPCYFLETDKHKIIIDCGATAPASLKKLKLPSHEVDVIIISHFHGDHFAGLPFFFLDASIMHKRKKKLFMVTPPGGKTMIQKLFSLLYPGSESVLGSFPVVYIEMDPSSTIEIKDLKIQSVKVKHNKQTLPHAIRISTKQRALAYSGDTGWTSELPRISRDCDLFICECNNRDTVMSGHLDLNTLSSHRQDFSVKNFMLTHLGKEMMNAENDHRLKDFLIARDGLVLEF